MTLEQAEKVKPGTLVRIKRQPESHFEYGYFQNMQQMGSIVEVDYTERLRLHGMTIYVKDLNSDYPWSFHYTDLEYVGEING